MITEKQNKVKRILKSPLVMVTVANKGYIEVIRRQGPVKKPVQCTYTEFMKLKELGYDVKTTEDPFMDVVEKDKKVLYVDVSEVPVDKVDDVIKEVVDNYDEYVDKLADGLEDDVKETFKEIVNNSTDDSKTSSETVDGVKEGFIEILTPTKIDDTTIVHVDDLAFVEKEEADNTSTVYLDEASFMKHTGVAEEDKIKLTKKEKKKDKKKKSSTNNKNQKYFKSVLLKNHNLEELKNLAKLEKISNEGTKNDIATRLSKISK